MSEDMERRRTGFEKDLREFALKVVLGAVLGVVLYMFIDWPGSMWVPVILGIVAVFILGSIIRGTSRHSD
ncbi:MAG: hypothetical protein WC054_00155 [Candidatus Nanopelagicales bacterium]